MIHRGITLIELLVAIAILLAIGAIVTPLMVRTLDERRFESAGEQIEQQMLLARSYAQRTGEPIEVRFHHDTRRIVARRFMIANDSGSSNVNSRSPATRERGAQDTDPFATLDLDDDQASIIIEAWAERTLPRGIDLSDQRPQRTLNDQRREFIDSEPGTRNSELDTPPLRLAVFLPDGSAMLTRTVWLTDHHDRLGRIRISPWTGTAKYARLPYVTEDRAVPAGADENAMLDDVFDSVWD
jgi:prepilin-type N-terminal cleavage/methylation domain-containing protein